MHRHLQFGMRENPASSRRHDSRLEVAGFSSGTCTENTIVTTAEPTDAHEHSFVPGNAFNAAPPHAATEEDERSAAQGFTVALQRLPSQRPVPTFEPLIGSPEAAKLLGNIHVKTLQRYARRRSIPGYQIGGHWYFRASELDSWLRSRLNSSCHPCRLQEKSDGT
jgi:excisionase family DNA binding protein